MREEGLDPVLKNKAQTDEKFIMTALRNHFVFYNLSEAELENVKEYMWWTEMPSETDIFAQGSRGSCFFIIASGAVDVIVDGKTIKTLKTGEGFGELALLYEVDRPSTVRSKDDVKMWVIDKVSFRESVEEIVIQ
jgi:cGMP-dependent protein kinase